ncbi:Uncharacterized protein APZ42_005189, partial [Daphnia magna]
MHVMLLNPFYFSLLLCYYYLIFFNSYVLFFINLMLRNFGYMNSSSFFFRIGSINATVAGVIGFLIILFVICCCICSCCILYKRRTAGTVYRSIAIPNSTVPSSVNVTVVHAPGAGMARGPPPVGFTAQPGGNQGTGYPVQPNYAPQPGYPVQPN